jgi:hypothetical protein
MRMGLKDDEARCWPGGSNREGLLMLSVAMTSLLIGVALGLRFKVLILVPVIGLTLAFAAVDGSAEDDVWRLVGTMVLAAISLQLGYIGGGVLHFVIGALRTADHTRASTRKNSAEVSPSGQLRNRGAASGRFEASKRLRQA